MRKYRNVNNYDNFRRNPLKPPALFQCNSHKKKIVYLPMVHRAPMAHHHLVQCFIKYIMAQSKSFFGLRRGSTKSLTFQVFEGKQVTKDRVYNVKNPQTDGQILQRMKLSPAQIFYANCVEILDHSWEGVSYGEMSRREFMREAMLTKTPYINRDDKTFYPLAVPVSSGSLQKVVCSINTAEVSLDSNIVTKENCIDEKTFIEGILNNNPQLQKGDQITALIFDIVSKVTVFKYARLILEVGKNPSLKFDDENNGFAATNDVAFISFDGKLSVANLTSTMVFAGAIIVSRLSSTGTWQRSPATITVGKTIEQLIYTYDASAINSFRAKTRSIVSNKYLNGSTATSGNTFFLVQDSVDNNIKYLVVQNGSEYAAVVDSSNKYLGKTGDGNLSELNVTATSIDLLNADSTVLVKGLSTKPISSEWSLQNIAVNSAFLMKTNA
jgi:hypothetical protein